MCTLGDAERGGWGAGRIHLQKVGAVPHRFCGLAPVEGLSVAAQVVIGISG